MEEQPGGFRLQLARRLDATPERVFAMLTDPAEVRKWWGPHGFTTLRADLDVWVGGRYRIRMQPPEGDPFHISGEFRTVEPPNQLAYTFRYDEPTPDDRETLVTVTLEAVGEQTQISLSQGLFATEERLSLHDGGWTDSLERLAAALGS